MGDLAEGGHSRFTTSLRTGHKFRNRRALCKIDLLIVGRGLLECEIEKGTSLGVCLWHWAGNRFPVIVVYDHVCDVPEKNSPSRHSVQAIKLVVESEESP